MLLIAILIRLSSSGPVIFKQRRTGLNGRVFTIYKFRTMLDGAEAMMMPAHRSITKGPIFKSSEDYRVTNVGHFLRRYSLDELPQFFNVLKGDMSLVGPRPLPVNEANAIQGVHRRRFRVLPGLTGIWQVSGRSDVEFDRWMKYDLEYVDNWSLGLDFKLLLKTAHVVLTGKGAY
jgi:lipopolysaccharide/colanic/teichoic acid biosynthesis glycosyltransferase